EVCGKSLVNPHIGGIGSRDAVAEPFVRALVNDNEIESRTDSYAGPIPPQVTVLEEVSVSDGALMFHAGIRRVDQFVAIFGERIRAEIVLVRLKHFFSLRELRSCLFEILG